VRRIVLLMLSLLVMTLLTGCWDRRELNEISVITGMAIDKGEQRRYKLTVELLNSAELNPKTGGNAAPSVVFTLEGNNVAELSHKMNLGVSRHLIYSHMRTVVIGEEVAKEGMLEFFDYLERSREIRSDFNIIVAKGTAAADILKVTYPLQKASSLKIVTQLRTLEQEWGGDPGVRLKDIIRALLSPGREPMMSVVAVRGDPEEGNSTGNMFKVKPDAIVVVDGLAVFQGTKYVGELPVVDIPYVLWVQNKLKKTALATACGDNDYFSAFLDSTHTKTKVGYENGKPVIDIRIDFEGRLESTGCELDVSKKEALIEYEKMLAQFVEERTVEVVRRVQKEFGADIFGFGEVLQRQHHRQFKKVEKAWNEEFVRAEVKVKATAKLRRSGLVKKPFLSEDS
jgi:spore germination protein KC